MDPNEDIRASDAQEVLAQMFPACCNDPGCKRCSGCGIYDQQEYSGHDNPDFVDDDPRIPR